ncbi:hypothetical protein NMY22_g15061 [Coprinellus aureogranulatus]|nr:hypothetical protein NMY22_g15061 [Coprinellus aureogranulatus]
MTIKLTFFNVLPASLHQATPVRNAEPNFLPSFQLVSGARAAGGLLDGPRNTELSLLNPLSPSQASTSKTLRRITSHQPTPRVSVDLRDESLMDALTSTFPSLLKQDKGEKQLRHIQLDREGSTRLLGPMEGNGDNVAMLRPSKPSSEAGSSSSSSPSAAHDFQSRTRSLFTLSLSPRSEEVTTTTSTTSSMIRSITRRLSSSAPLRSQPAPDHDVEGKKSLHDQDHGDVFEGSGRTLHRKKRLQQPPPVAVLPPLQTGSGLKKKA